MSAPSQFTVVHQVWKAGHGRSNASMKVRHALFFFVVVACALSLLKGSQRSSTPQAPAVKRAKIESSSTAAATPATFAHRLSAPLPSDWIVDNPSGRFAAQAYVLVLSNELFVDGALAMGASLRNHSEGFSAAQYSFASLSPGGGFNPTAFVVCSRSDSTSWCKSLRLLSEHQRRFSKTPSTSRTCLRSSASIGSPLWTQICSLFEVPTHSSLASTGRMSAGLVRLASKRPADLTFRRE